MGPTGPKPARRCSGRRGTVRGRGGARTRRAPRLPGADRGAEGGPRRRGRRGRAAGVRKGMVVHLFVVVFVSVLLG